MLSPLDVWGRDPREDRINGVVQLLLASNADVSVQDADGQTPLHLAAFGGQVKVVKMLIAAGADVNAKNNHGETPLHTAILWTAPSWGGTIIGPQDRATIGLLLDSGANIDARSDYGATPLEYAEDGADNEIVELLRQRRTTPAGVDK